MMLSACAAVPDALQMQDITIAGDRVHPESITSDAAGNLYVSSIPGTIYRALAGDTVAQPWITPDGENGLESLFGVLADERHSLLWTCSNPNMFAPGGAGGGSRVVAFTLPDGAFHSSYPFPDGPAACNDIAVEDSGAIFVTDTAAGRIFRIARPGAPLDLFAAGENLVGVDGIAFAGNGTLFINNVRSNKVQRVERSGQGAYAGLTDLALSEPVSGPDGLRPLGGNLFLQAEGSGNRVTLVEIDGDSATITPVRTGLDSAPGVTRVGRVAYATEGKIGYLIDPELRGQDPGVFTIRAFLLPEGS